MFNLTQPTAKSKQTRERILGTALRLFRERGFDETTMREIAAEAGLALGAAYYYFPSKEALVHAYYVHVQSEHQRRLEQALADSPGLDLKERVRLAMRLKLEIIRDDRGLLGALFRYSGEPAHPLSCFGPATRDVRQQSLAVFARAMGDEQLPGDIRAALPLALWAMHMAIMLFFLYDDSPDQQRTGKLVDGAVEIAIGLLSLARLPLLRPFRGKVWTLLREIGLLKDAADQTPEFVEAQS